MACIGLINGYRRCATAPKYAPKTVKKRHEITSYTARYGENRFYDARYILLLLCKLDTIYSGFDTKYALDMYRKSAYNRKCTKRKAKALRLCRRGETEREVKRMIRYIVKRSGDKVSFDARKIKSAHYAKGTPSPHEAAPTGCKRTVSGSFSLPCSGYFSPFPHGTGPLSVSWEYLALRGGPRKF